MAVGSLQLLPPPPVPPWPEMMMPWAAAPEVEILARPEEHVEEVGAGARAVRDQDAGHRSGRRDVGRQVLHVERGGIRAVEVPPALDPGTLISGASNGAAVDRAVVRLGLPRTGGEHDAPEEKGGGAGRSEPGRGVPALPISLARHPGHVESCPSRLPCRHPAASPTVPTCRQCRKPCPGAERLMRAVSMTPSSPSKGTWARYCIAALAADAS